jgi:hypothetical protein
MTRGMHQVVLLALLFVAASLSAAAVPAPALARCNPFRTNNGIAYDVWHRNSDITSTGGVYANLLNYSVYAATSAATRGVVGFDYPADATNKYAEIGWTENNAGTRHTMVQYIKSGSVYTFNYGSYRTGSYTYYTALYDPSNQQMKFEAAGTTLKQVTGSWVPYRGYLDSVIWTLASQMPGGTSAHEWWKDAHVYRGGWHNFNETSSTTNTTYFGLGSTDSLTYSGWDKSCST